MRTGQLRFEVKKNTGVSQSIQEPAMDFIPEDLFKDLKGKGKPPSAYNIPLVEIKHKGVKLRGVMFHATSWNPEPGCLRVLAP